MSNFDPYALWIAADRDPFVYKQMMIDAGLIVPITEENRPEPHDFQAMTPSCACTICGGAFAAEWHTGYEINRPMRLSAEYSILNKGLDSEEDGLDDIFRDTPEDQW